MLYSSDISNSKSFEESLKGKRFDIILGRFGMGYSQSPEELVKVFYRRLKIGGMLVLTEGILNQERHDLKYAYENYSLV